MSIYQSSSPALRMESRPNTGSLAALTRTNLRRYLKQGVTAEQLAIRKKVSVQDVWAVIKENGFSILEKTIRDNEEYTHLLAINENKLVYLEQMTGEIGGKCLHCGYKENPMNLCFHHVVKYTDGPFRDLPKRPIYTRRMEIREEEKEHCTVLCSHCHEDLHFKADIPQRLADVGSRTYHRKVNSDRPIAETKIIVAEIGQDVVKEKVDMTNVVAFRRHGLAIT